MKDVPRIDMPHELADEAFAMEPGTITGPLPTRIGWSSIRVESFEDADPERFEGLKGSLWELVRYRKAEVLRADLGTRLRAAHPVVIDEEVADGIVAERLTDARLMPKVEDPEAVVARVGERTITAGDYGDALKRRWKGVRNEEAALAARPLVLERLIRNELMAGRGPRSGVRRHARRPKRALDAYETQLLVPRFLNEVVAGRPGGHARRRWRPTTRGSKEHFHRPPRVHLGQITVATEEEAERIAELLRQGTDLAWLARQHSTDGFKDAGGDRGWVTPKRSGDALEEALFEAQPGDVLGPRRSGRATSSCGSRPARSRGSTSLEEISGNVRKAV